MSEPENPDPIEKPADEPPGNRKEDPCRPIDPASDLSQIHPSWMEEVTQEMRGKVPAEKWEQFLEILQRDAADSAASKAHWERANYTDEQLNAMHERMKARYAEYRRQNPGLEYCKED